MASFCDYGPITANPEVMFVASLHNQAVRYSALISGGLALNKLRMVLMLSSIGAGSMFAAQRQPAADVRIETPHPHVFEVASIRPANDQERARFQIQPGGTYLIQGATLSYLIQQAYDVRDYQVSGPSWLNIQRYDIVAKTNTGESGGTSDPDLMRLRLQALLADRFGVRLHRESKQEPAYSLVVAKGGSKLIENHSGVFENHMDRRVGYLKGTNVAMRFVALTLSRQVGRTVIDETGLTATYDFELHWAPDPTLHPTDLATLGPPQSASQDGPSIFTAVQEQLGLKLEPRKGPVDLLVIDQALPPTEN